MANARNRTHATLLCLLAITACAEGTSSLTDTDQLTESNAGSTSGSGGEQALAGSSGAGVSAGTAGSAASNAGGSFNAGGSPSAGSSSGGTSGGVQLMGGASGSATAGASAMGGTSMGGNATAGASSAGKGGTSAGGSGGSSAACSGAKPESNCVCHSNSNHDYWFCPTARNFADSELKCVGAGLHLVKIASAAEDKWVNDTANAATFGEYYLGSTDASTPNTWRWLAGGTFWTGLANGTASGYAHWGANQPDGSGDCLVVQNNFVWDDRICTDNRLYICD